MSEGKAGLTAYIVQQSENIDAWQEWREFTIHTSSGIAISTERRLWWINLLTVEMPDSGRYYLDDHKRLHVGFTMIQKWKIHRKLNKLKQRMTKRKAEEAAQKALEKMVAGTWGGKEAVK